jgi:S-(hydroxymethyl)glutathione dehydrogenase/alcohol dehydrogenase
MKAIVFHKPKEMRFEEVSDPILKASDDLILRVTSTAICGSDLHIYNGFLPQTRPMVMGYEFMGMMEESDQVLQTLESV